MGAFVRPTAMGAMSRALTLLVTVLVLGACSTVNSNSETSAEQPALSWEPPEAYSFTVTSECGERNFLGTYDVTVNAGEVVELRVHEDGWPHARPEDAPSLEDLLDHARNPAGDAVVDYRADDAGRPMEVSIDHDPRAIDDEECYRIRGIAELPGGNGTTESSEAPSQDGAATTAHLPILDTLPVSIDADLYAYTDTVQHQVDWGSHVVVAEVIDEQVGSSYPSGVERSLDLRVQSLLWSHPDAITALEDGDRIRVDAGIGWRQEGSALQPVVHAGNEVRLEVGDRYVVALADTVTAAGEQGLLALPGSARAVPERLDELSEQLASLSPDPAIAPRPGEAFDQRVVRSAS